MPFGVETVAPISQLHFPLRQNQKAPKRGRDRSQQGLSLYITERKGYQIKLVDGSN